MMLDPSSLITNTNPIVNVTSIINSPKAKKNKLEFIKNLFEESPEKTPEIKLVSASLADKENINQNHNVRFVLPGYKDDPLIIHIKQRKPPGRIPDGLV